MQTNLSQLLDLPAEAAAARLLGSELVREVNGHKLVGRIVETEAYDQHDTASHSYHGDTPRTHVMFGPAGFLYVYFTYGMHYCMNVVVGKDGYGAAALIRAIEPLAGLEIMTANRHGLTGPLMTNGPAKTCQALAVDRSLNGQNLAEGPFQLVLRPPLTNEQIIQTTRIGISNAKDKPWRFYIKENKFVSHAKLA